MANDDTATTDQDTLVTINVATNDFDRDLDGGPLTVISVTQGANGTVLNHGNGTVTYTPNVGFYGQDSFTYTISDGEDGTASATVIVTVNPLSADLSVTQSDSPDPVTLSSNLTYNIIVANHGPSAATGVILTDQLDPGVAFEGVTSSQGSCSEARGIVTCILGFLANGDNATGTIVVVPTRAGSVTNAAHVAGNELDASLTNNESIEDTTVTQPDLPDLVVPILNATGPATINPQGEVEVPIQVTIRNQGGSPANIFKVSTEYTGPNGTFVVRFTVPGQGSIWYPYTRAPLATGSDIAFTGKVIFHPASQGLAISLRATADSCSGDEFMPGYCRVEEKDEGNNVSTPLSILLPTDLPPEVTITNPSDDQ